MKYVISENRLNDLTEKYLDTQDWWKWDIGDGEFDVSDGYNGENIFKFRHQFSSMDPEHSFNVLYISESIIHLINNLFSMDSIDSRKLIIDWFNKKFDKNLTVDDVEWFGWMESEEEDDD